MGEQKSWKPPGEESTTNQKISGKVQEAMNKRRSRNSEYWHKALIWQPGMREALPDILPLMGIGYSCATTSPGKEKQNQKQNWKQN